ncbi:MAG: YlcI/YnfO family protein [Pseudomonadota bacterium]
MKTATLPSIRVEPEFRATVESLLRDSETLTEFVENSIRETVDRRRNQAEFIARGMASLEDAKRRNDFVDADVVVGNLRQRIANAKAQLRSKSR